MAKLVDNNIVGVRRKRLLVSFQSGITLNSSPCKECSEANPDAVARPFLRIRLQLNQRASAFTNELGEELLTDNVME